jgi:hypothetical protein
MIKSSTISKLDPQQTNTFCKNLRDSWTQLELTHKEVTFIDRVFVEECLPSAIDDNGCLVVEKLSEALINLFKLLPQDDARIDTMKQMIYHAVGDELVKLSRLNLNEQTNAITRE